MLSLSKKIRSALIAAYTTCFVSLFTLILTFYLASASIAVTQERNAQALSAIGITDITSLNNLIGSDMIIVLILIFGFGVGIILPSIWILLQQMFSLSDDYEKLKKTMDLEAHAETLSPIMVCSVSQGKVLYANASTVKALGYNGHKELFLTSIYDHLDLTMYSYVIDGIITNKDSNETLYTKAYMKDRTTKPVCITVYPVYADSEDLPRYIHFVLNFKEVS